jgi:parallel beta-helix repeat protein
VKRLTNKRTLQVLTIVLISLAAIFIISVQRVNASKTIVVPDQYNTINEAINHASPGDIIQVKSGIYNENLPINKSLTLQGQNRQNTVIIGEGGAERGANPVIALGANDIKISGFTIASQNYSITNLHATGILVQADRCTISYNRIENNYIGIFCPIQSSTTITNNEIIANFKDGMRFYGGSQNIISNNIITGNGGSGIAMQGYQNTITNNTINKNTRAIGYGGSYSAIYNNKLESNTESGLFLAGSDNVISSNDFSQNKYGLFVTTQLGAPHGNTFYQNNFKNNNHNAFDNSSSFAEQWNNEELNGNYWSDYQTKYPNASESSKSGIGDTAYYIAPNNTDYYPLLNPLEDTNQNQLPILPTAPTAPEESLVSWWPFEIVESNGMTPDVTGNNPAALGSETGAKSYVPNQIEGKIGKALNFNGEFYVTVQPSKSLEITRQITIDVWVNVQSLKENVAYNNIIVECVRTSSALPTRTLGIAINGEAPQNSSSPIMGAIRAYVLTDDGFNEIATTTPIEEKTWVHIVFTRSLDTGLHIYVDGKEQPVQVVSGVQNPSGETLRQNEIYIGHDSIIQIDELKISNFVEGSDAFLTQWWIWAIIVGVGAVSLLVLYRLKR